MFLQSHRSAEGWWVASELRLEWAAPLPRLEKETQTQGGREGPWTSPCPTPNAH